MSVKSFIELLCKSLPSERVIASNLAFLESLITKEHVQPEALKIEPHDMYNQKRIKEQAIKFQQEWFY